MGSQAQGSDDQFEVGEDPEPGAPGQPAKRSRWAPHEIDEANCTFVNLTELADSDGAKQFALANVRLRLIVYWGAFFAPVAGQLLTLDATRESIALTFGCSPRNAKAPTQYCYRVQVVGIDPATGGFRRVISDKQAYSFVVEANEAAVRPWHFDASYAQKMPDDMVKHVAWRATATGRHRDTGALWAEPSGQPQGYPGAQGMPGYPGAPSYQGDMDPDGDGDPDADYDPDPGARFDPRPAMPQQHAPPQGFPGAQWGQQPG
jgi:hypothetical protein